METRVRRPSSPQRIQRDLPMELLTEVLMRLPVKTIGRFTCVCKAWCSLLSSTPFLSLHFAHVKSKDCDPPFLTSYICDKKTGYMFRSSRTYRKVLGCDNRIRIPQHLNDLEDFRMVSSCDSGLLLLISKSPGPRELMLWNPLLGKTHTLPLPPIPVCDSKSYVHGFNSLSNDYKVVMIATFPKTSVHIYDLSVQTWRSISDYDERIVGKVWSSSVMIGGNMHWVSIKRYNDRHMISFDVNSEVFNYAMLPIELSEDPYHQVNYPVNYREKLGLLNVSTANCSLWVMEKDKAPLPWIKLYRVTLPFYDHTIRVLNCNKDGQLMFATRKGGVKVYDFEREKMKDIMITFPNDLEASYSTLYRESLLLL